MKKNDIFLIAGSLLYSYLFYKQEAGINLFLFTLVLEAFLLIRNPTRLYNGPWLIAACGSILTGVCAAWHGSLLSVVANVISLSALAGLSIAPKTSFILTLFFAAYSYVSAPVFMIIDDYNKRLRKRTEKPDASEKQLVKWMSLAVAPFAVGLTFFLLYRSANPVFNEYASRIKLDFISADLVFFTIGGLILLYGFLYPRQIAALAAPDAHAPNNLSPGDDAGKDWLRKYLNLPLEYKSALVLFGLLNVLLLSVNILDLIFLYFDHDLPEELTYAQFLHQGVGALITSVVLAAAIILLYFRGELNFYKQNTWLKFLVYLWIAQNIFMVISTAWRNELYIEEYSLTYKRIGVYFYLGLTIIGLLFTAIKVAGRKTNWYLFRVNAWAFYIVMVGACFVSWPALVAKYNTQFALRKNKPLDPYYLINLSYQTLPYLAEYNGKAPLDSTSSETLNYHAHTFLEHEKTLDWQSWNYDRQQTAQTLQFQSETKQIQTEN
jgi:hypothetical protein